MKLEPVVVIDGQFETLCVFLPDNVVIYSEKDEFEKLKTPPPKTVKR